MIGACSSSACWKCKGHGRSYQKSTQSHDGDPCKVCNGKGHRVSTGRSRALANQPGRIVQLRGYPNDHPFKQLYPDGFSGPRAVWGSSRRQVPERVVADDGSGHTLDVSKNERNENDAEPWQDLPQRLWPRQGEVVGSLSGDWRIYQVANGNKLTVDDFICAWVAAHEMRKRGYGGDRESERKPLFGGISVQEAEQLASKLPAAMTLCFTHADLGTGCGSVLMMLAWAFLGQIRSVGVEAQEVSYDCLQRGLLWNLGRDGSDAKDIVRAQRTDLRMWNGISAGDVDNESGQDNDVSVDGTRRYRLITGTPPYFPLDSFVASENHEQKVRCRVPTRGGAVDYIQAASRLLIESKDDGECHGDDTGGVFCMVEAAFDKAIVAVLEAAKAYDMTVERRVDVITRDGLPPRFSCWVMTKKKKTKNTGNETTTEMIAPTTTTTAPKVNATFPIQTLTLRNKDLSRTKAYSTAMEEMGWVDFEGSICKSERTMVDFPRRTTSMTTNDV